MFSPHVQLHGPHHKVQLRHLGGVFHSQAVLEHASGAGGAIVTDPQGVGGGVKLILVSLAREHQQDVLCNKVL